MNRTVEMGDVDLFRKTVTVVRSKNGEKRTIPLNQKAFELLKEKAKVRHIRNSNVFASEAGSKILQLLGHKGPAKCINPLDFTV